MRRRWGRAGVVGASFVLLAGCGGSSAPSDDVPALGDALDQVDEAIVAGQYDDARSALDELVATATAGREGGELGREEADRILAAAADLSAALPEEAAEEPEPSEPEPSEPEPSEPEPTEPEPTEPEPSEPAPEEPTEEETQSEEDAEKEQEELEKELEKEQKEAEKEAEDSGNNEEGGNGNSG